FFFQAEDGIRDRNVTGVQTCALPISSNDPTSASVCLNRACSAEAIVKSLTTCRLWPPPAAHPGTTQMTTLGINRMSRWHSRMWKIGRASCREREKSREEEV